MKDALYFQLNERILFIKPKDKIISVLLFELGNIALLMDENLSADAAEIYELSKKYGFQNNLLNERLIICYKNMNNFCLKSGNSLNKMAAREQKMSTELFRKGREKDDFFGKTIIVFFIISLILLVSSILFFLKWKKLKKSISTS